MPKRTVLPANRARARSMRREMTNAEFRLWWRLRRPGIEGLRFRRQVPIGPYIVDFLCPERALIVEVDGDQHGHDEAMARDKVRTEWLAQNGYQVIRFWNDEVVSNIDGVCSTILAAAQDRSPR